MGQAYVDISGELILSALCFPEGTKIIAAGNGEYPGDVRLLVDHEDLDDIGVDGDTYEPPLIHPKFEQRSPVHMVDWGQKEDNEIT